GNCAPRERTWPKRRRRWRVSAGSAGSPIPRAIGSSCGSPPDRVVTQAVTCWWPANAVTGNLCRARGREMPRCQRNARIAGRHAGTGTRMACCISELVIDCRDPERLAAFWCDVLGYVVLDRVENSVEIGPEDEGFGGLQPTIVFDLTDKPTAGTRPLQSDVSPTDRDQDEELERLLAVGAKPADVGQTGEESWHVLADPEGNEFCLLRRRLSG